MNNEKKVLGVSTLAVIALIVIMVGATYAFFKGVDAANTDTPLEVTTNTVDSLIFNIDADITLVADMSNFTEGLDNRVGEAHATATLKANNKTNSATDHYYLYFDIKENGLTYTTEDSTPELLLQVSGPDGEVTSIVGLNYVTVEDGQGNEVSGFDITTRQDLITIVSNKGITTTNTKVDDWDVKVILVNLGEDQSANGGKKFNGELIIQKEAKPTIATVCNGQNLAQCIKENYNLDSNIYYHEPSLENGAGDSSYRYAGSYDAVENYVCFGYDGDGECPWNNMYRIIGVFENQVKLIKADYATWSNLGTSYSYANKYSSTDLGGVNKGKITADQIGTYVWNNNSENNWKTSNLNIENLNTSYLNSFNETWRSKIATTSWQIGGNALTKVAATNPKDAYQNEIVSPNTSVIENKKIGLMYVSDYYYGATPENWTKHGYTQSGNPHSSGNIGIEYDYRSAIGSNWMYMGLWEWTITASSGYVDGVYYIGTNGYIWNNNCGPSYGGRAVRPCFYLNSEVTLTSGDGSINSPYRIS